MGTRLARKQLGPQWAQHPDTRARFEREIELLSKMHHPNIVSLVGVSASPTERYYVMPLYPQSLRDVINSAPRRRGVVDVARFGVLLADALRYAHGEGFLHRDLKPENILLRGSTEVVIADWGIGQFVHKTSKVLNLTAGGIGTDYYCSAEQWTNGHCDARSDIYSLGVVLAEVALGSRTPISPTGAGIRVDVVPATEPGGALFNAIIRQMTGVVPQMRHASMAEVVQALRRLG